MSTGYIDVPFEQDPNVMVAAALDYIIANVPGWLPKEGNLEVWLIEALCHRMAESVTVASRIPAAIFRYYGRTLVDIPPIEAARATTTTTWTMIDNQGYTIQAGTLVAFQVAGDVLIPFRTVVDVVVPPGATSTEAGEVVVEAVEPGMAASGVPAGPMRLLDALTYVDTVDAVDATTGGADAETDVDYLDRLAEELALLAPRPILPGDAAVMARRVPGVYRALALDGYDPGTATFGNERMVSLAMVDESGAAVPLAVKNAVLALLDAQREVNFVFNAVDPTITAVDVDFTGTALAGFVPTDVRDRAIAAVQAYLSPAVWGGGDLQPPVWQADGIVRYLEVATVLNNVAGLDHVTALTIEGAAANYALAGVAALPTPGAITGAVT